jgi:hypothetical protein
MTRRDDRFANMLSSTQVDAAIERVLRGAPVGDDDAPLATFVDDLRVMAGPPPLPSPELAALLAGRTATEAASAITPSSSPGKRRRARARSTRPSSGRSRAAEIRLRVGALGLTGKAAVSIALAGTVAAGGAAGILPEPATHFLRRAIEVITPFDLPDHATEHPPHSAHTKRNAGVTTGDRTGDAPLPRPGPQPAALAPEAPGTDVPPIDIEGRADAGTPAQMNPTADTSSGVRPHPKKGASPAQGPKPATPPSTPPGRDDATSGQPPHEGQPSKPKAEPQRDHVPPGPPPSGSPHPENTHAGPQPKDHEPAEDRSVLPEPNDPRRGTGSSPERPRGHGGLGSRDGPMSSDGSNAQSRGGPPPGQALPCVGEASCVPPSAGLRSEPRGLVAGCELGAELPC